MMKILKLLLHYAIIEKILINSGLFLIIKTAGIAELEMISNDWPISIMSHRYTLS